MKKLFLTALIAFFTTILAQGQSNFIETNRIPEDISFSNMVYDRFAFNGKGSIYTYDYNDDYTHKTITFYNNDIQKTASIEIDGYVTNYVMYKSRQEDENGNFTGEWTEEKHNEDLDFELTPGCYDSSSPSNSNESILFSQTLFNNDEKYEYIVPAFSGFEIRWHEEYDRDSDGEIDLIEEHYRASYAGYDVINEDGNIVCSIRPNLSNGFIIEYSPNIQVLGGKKYLVVYASTPDYEMWEYIYYLIDSNNSSIQQVAEPIHTSVFPTMPRQNEVINVELDGNNDEQCEIIVTNAKGQIVHKQHVAAGERHVQIDSRRLSNGLNIVNVNNGKSQQNFKVIVK